MTKIIKKKKGFTLIELIIVIIGIIAAIAVPKFSGIQKNAKLKTDIASARVIADATNALISEEGITKTTYSTAKALGTEIKDYLQSVPLVKAVTGEFYVKIDSTNDNVEVSVQTGTGATGTNIILYPTPAGIYGPPIVPAQ